MAAVNKAPPYPKQKYSDSKFREIIPLLPLNEYLKIEYLAKGVWFKMISKRLNSYNCECCGVDNVGPTPITDHVRGKKHRFALQTAERLYHPNYTTPKNSNAPARTPILDAYNGAAGGNLAAKQTKVTVTSKAEAQAAAKTSVQQKGGIQPKPQPRVAANANKKPIEPAQTPVAPKTNVTVGKTTLKPPELIQPKEETAAEKPVEMPKQIENIKKVEDLNESDIVVLIDDDDDVPVKNDPVPNVEVTGTTPVASTPVVSTPVVSTPVVSTPVVSTPVVSTPVVSTPETAKPQRAQKRNASAVQAQESAEKASNAKPVSVQGDKPPGKNGNESTTTINTPTIKVVNPAALLAKSAEKSSENMPRYQQNRVIIPTVDKTKKKPSPIVHKEAVVDVAPTFSSKKFSMSNEIEGIIGVEYVVKILKVYNDPEPFYECCLCEVVMDGVGMQTHLLGYNHRYKYIEKHFPTCFNQYKDHIGNIQVMGIILDRVSRAIEDHHGRELPYECLSGEFRSNRHGVMTTVYSFRHASEYSGPSFTNVVDNKQIDEIYKKKQMYHPPKPDPKRKPTFDTRSGAPETKRSRVDRRGNGPPNNSRGTNGSSRRPYREEIETNVMDDAVHKQMVEEFLQNTRGRSRSPAGGRRRRHRSRTRSRSPHRSSRRRAAARRSLSPLREGDVWQAYRHLVDRSKTELEQLYSDYRKDPEKHPLYDEEWRKFWKHRKEQMSREGLDHRNYDFQPEWVRYFAVRIEELYDEAVEDIKVSSRRRLILPMTNDELEDTRYHVKTPIEEEPVEIVKPMLQYPQVIVDNKPSVVSVLRLLTALEDYLGSLGPRVVDLLSKALLVEKTHPREINEIVLTIDNCTVLETAMEKLKGVLIAGLLEGPKVRAFNNVIMETEKILKLAYKIKQRNPQPVPQPVPAPKSQQEFQKSTWSQGGGSFIPSPQSNSMGGSAVTTGAAASLLSQIDKKELASKLAAALTAQGKTDFNPEQLQQLIAVYSLIDKKKRDSAAASDKQKMTLSDTLTALLAPTEKSGDVGSGPIQSSGRGNYSNSNIDRIGERPGSLTNSSINSFVSMLNRDGNSTGSGGADSQMWQNLQNIQNSLRTQNTMGASSNTGGYASGSMGRISGGGSGEGMGGGSGYMGNADNLPSVGNFNRGGFSGGSSTGGGGTGAGFNLSQNSSLHFNRSGPSGGDNSGGYGSNFQSMSGNNSGGFSRGGGGDDMLGGAGGGRGMGGNFSSGRMGGGISSLPRGIGGIMGGGGGGSNSGFSRSGGDNFQGGSGAGGSSGGFGGSLSSGLINYPTGGNSNYQRGLGGMGGGSNSALGQGLGLSSGTLGGSFSRSGGGGGGNSMNNNFNNLMTNKNTVRNDGGGSSFASNQRNMGGNDVGGPSFGSTQRSMAGNDGSSLGFGSNQRNIGGHQQNRGGSGNLLMGPNSNNSHGQGGNRGGGSSWRNQ